ncbi:transposase [Aerococcaceae bacterium DSM 111176]|nr:transposase [Aerococcaceae bacterium DSM 111176]
MSQKYDSEYKEYACRLVIEEHRTSTDVADELGLSRSTLSRWVKAYKNNTGWASKYAELQQSQPEGQEKVYMTPKDLKEENEELKRMNENYKEELAILKKAMHIFAQNPE